MRRRVEGGAGWHIDPDTLLPVLTDEGAFRRAHAEDAAVDVLVELWAGSAVRAERLLTERAGDIAPLRHRALLLDSWRDQGRIMEAVEGYRALVDETRGTAREATMRQHLGKALFVAQQYEAAQEQFQRAYTLRLGDDDELAASSWAALTRARELQRAET